MRRVIVFLLIAVALTGCSRRPVAEGPNILLVTFDTVRADRFGCYGWKNAGTPNVDKLAAEGVLYETCLAPAPITLPSHASILNGRYPSHHGVRINGSAFPPEELTITEQLYDMGYDTAAFVSAFVLHSKYGLGQGFATYEDSVGDSIRGLVIDERPANETCNQLLAWLKKPRRRPFFVWLHFFDPHEAYSPPDEWAKRYPRDPYQGEIAFADSELGIALEAMDLDNTLVVFTGDHGESLGQHGETSHGYFAYDSSMLVPLVVRFPDGRDAGTRVETPVSLVDIAPTILAYLGQPPLPDADGIDVAGDIASLDPERRLYFECALPYAFGWSPIAGLRTKEWKYIHSPKAELYNVAADPGELKNLIRKKKKIAQDFATELTALDPFALLVEAKEKKTLSTSDRKILESLGYIGGVGESGGDITNLPDAKDRLACFNKFNDSTSLTAVGELEIAERVIREVIEDCPDMLRAKAELATILREAGKYDEAIPMYEEIIAGESDNLVIWHLVVACNLAGRYEDAIKHCLRGLETYPDEDMFYDQLGLAYRMTGDLENAVKSAKKAVELVGNRPGYLVNLGAAYSMSGKFGPAQEALEHAISIQPMFTEAHFNLGVLYMRKEDYTKAESYLRQSIGANEMNVDAWVQLNKVLLFQERPNEALEISTVLEELRPGAPGNDYFKSVAYQQQGEFEEAEKALRAFLAASPDFGPGYVELCQVLLSQDPPALEAAREAAKEASARGVPLPADLAKQLGP